MTVHYLYRIVVPDGRAYIGVAMKPGARFYEHCVADSYIGEAIRRYGHHNCVLDILYDGSKEYIYALEKWAIKEFNTLFPAGYNRISGYHPPIVVPKCIANATELDISFRSGVPAEKPSQIFRVGKWEFEE